MFRLNAKCLNCFLKVDMHQAQLPMAMELLNVCRCKSASTQTVQMEGLLDDELPLATTTTSTTQTNLPLDQPELPNMPVGEQPNPGGFRKKRKSMEHTRSISSSVFEAETGGSSTQIVGIDQWSSSGTESTTGVILRGANIADAVEGWNSSLKTAENTASPQHSASCPHSAGNPEAYDCKTSQG